MRRVGGLQTPRPCWGGKPPQIPKPKYVSSNSDCEVGSHVCSICIFGLQVYRIVVFLIFILLSSEFSLHLNKFRYFSFRSASCHCGSLCEVVDLADKNSIELVECSLLEMLDSAWRHRYFGCTSVVAQGRSGVPILLHR